MEISIFNPPTFKEKCDKHFPQWMVEVKGYRNPFREGGIDGPDIIFVKVSTIHREIVFSDQYGIDLTSRLKVDEVTKHLKNQIHERIKEIFG